MRNDVCLDNWAIRASGASLEDSFLDSVFFSGNGRMGVRGYPAFRPAPRPVDTGLFVAGFFDEFKAGITDFVNLPTPAWMTVSIDGQAAQLSSHITRELDMSVGKYTAAYTVQARETILDVLEERFFPPDNPALLIQRFTLAPHGEPGRMTLNSGIELVCCNQPVPDDQVKQNDERICYVTHGIPEFGEDGFQIDFATRHTQLKAHYKMTFHTRGFQSKAPFGSEDAVGFTFCGECAPGNTFTLEALTYIQTSRDVAPTITPMPENWTFEALVEANMTAWSAKWDNAAIALEGDDEAQTALRYVVYQLTVNCSAQDDTVSIGARGLTHTRYKGCYFWDTDFFMLPFYLLTDPKAAQSLTRYRVNTLPRAKEHAQKMNGAGARYPWMASYDGTEQCETWDIGCSELHVTADVAYALGQYLDHTRDKELFLQGGAELLIETARFWVSRYSPAQEEGKVNLLFCKGPDEYCGITSNNLFTNMMVQHNLTLAVRAANALMELDPAQYQRLSLSEAECETWKQLYAAIKLPRDPVTGHWRTDDTFHTLEPVDPKALKEGDAASYHHVCFDRLQRYQVVKQADVLLLMTRLPQNFTHEEKLAAWEDFEPLCLHDSTLSFASHALFAAQNGLDGPAADYFRKALFLDLRDIMGNTGKEGLHLAGLGETWQAVIFGFAGLHFASGSPQLKPHLPDRWRRLSFRFRYRGRFYLAEATPSGAQVFPCARS